MLVLTANHLHMCDVKSLLLAFNSIYVVEHYRCEVFVCDGNGARTSVAAAYRQMLRCVYFGSFFACACSSETFSKSDCEHSSV